MSLLAPLGLIGLICLPVIAALWMLKLRRPERDVSSTFLWQHLVRDVEANSPWQRLRRSLLLLLQLLCALLLVAVVVRPALERPAALAHDLVLVVDASASMSATDVPLDRLDAARRAATDALAGLPAGGRVSVIAAGDTARVVANEVTDRGQASRAIGSIEPSVGTGDMEAALRLADALAARATGSQILVVSDASGPVPPDLRLSAPVAVLTVGRERDNQAIAALAVRADPGGLRRQVFVSVANESASVVPRRLELLADGTVFTARDLALDGLTRHDVVIDELPADARVVEARLTAATSTTGVPAPDHLALDDRAWAVVPDQRVRNVLLIGDGSLFLRNALGLLPDVELYGVTEQEWEAGTAREGTWDLVVLEGVVPDPLPQAPTIAFAPPASSALGEVSGTLAAPGAGTPSPDEPLLRDVDLSRFHVGRAQRMVTPGWARVVVPGPADAPLIYSGTRDGQPTTVFAFRLEDSDLPLQVAWPILLGNVSAELLGRDASSTAPLRPGSVVELPLGQGVTGIRV
ncbi:MAG: VWA domain-containing protein, partial [Candidatus Limnocylindrales bacterium]